LTPEPPPGQFGKYVSQLLGDYPESHERLDLFEKLGGTTHRELLEKRARSQETLALTGADVIVAKAIAKGRFDKSDIEVHHFKARYAKGVVLFSISEQKILDYVPINWNELIAKKKSTEDTAVAEDDKSDKTDLPTEKPTALAESIEE